MMLKTSIIAIVITYVSAGPESEPCEPGTKFSYYCNQCFCDVDGTGAACTRKYCPPGIYTKDGNLKNSDDVLVNQSQIDKLDKKSHVESGYCQPGSRFKHFCNICVCSSNGFDKACTKQYCIPGRYNEDGSLTNNSIPDSSNGENTRFGKDLPELPQVGDCEQGKYYKQNCNRCACLEGGQVACTQMRCQTEENSVKPRGSIQNDLPKLPKDGKCVPKALHRMGCNVCLCGADGQSFSCKYGGCIGQRRKNGLKLDTRKCQSGSIFLPNQCFKCTCLGNGESICTSSGCLN